MRRLLFIDDEESILFVLKAYFELEGYAVDVASSEQAARALLMEKGYDAVVADLRLAAGGTEGPSLLAEARRHEPSPRTILLTGDEVPESAEGTDASLCKPLSLPELGRILAGLIAG